MRNSSITNKPYLVEYNEKIIIERNKINFDILLMSRNIIN